MLASETEKDDVNEDRGGIAKVDPTIPSWGEEVGWLGELRNGEGERELGVNGEGRSGFASPRGGVERERSRSRMRLKLKLKMWEGRERGRERAEMEERGGRDETEECIVVWLVGPVGVGDKRERKRKRGRDPSERNNHNK